MQTFSLIQAFFLVLASFPEVQEKARAELDAVVGPHRLPDFNDRDALPYVCAVIKECMRWHAIAPLGIPHRLIQDDEYRGYLIPKGALVIPNIWYAAFFEPALDVSVFSVHRTSGRSLAMSDGTQTPKPSSRSAS